MVSVWRHWMRWYTLARPIPKSPLLGAQALEGSGWRQIPWPTAYAYEDIENAAQQLKSAVDALKAGE